MGFFDRTTVRMIALSISVIFGIVAAVFVSSPLRNQAAAAGFDVSIQGFAFRLPTTQVSVGDTVRWTNKDSVAHTATSSNGA
ncbi:MAG: hypothetical protein EXR50_05895 [Dehalococcoidia bacterium]|nr:hypothetical protein [Dehalococcoidia bacterium]